MALPLKELIQRNRSYRRFVQTHGIGRKILEELVDLARLAPSAGNKQPLKYILSCEKEKNSRIFPHLGWAAYLKDWPGPAEGERPSAYIVILADKSIDDTIRWGDHSIAAMSILLGATEMGLGGCMIGSIKKDGLAKDLGIPGLYEPMMVVALGKPKEKVIIDPVSSMGDIKYWRDAGDIHHVPKRSLGEIILNV